MFFTSVRRALISGALAIAVSGAVQASDAADWYPGIPPNDGTVDDTWVSLGAGGIGYSNLAKQWFRNPAGMTIARSRARTVSSSLALQHTKIKAQAFLVSPSDAPSEYGYLAPVTVRSVGFGLIPVEATIRVSQRRVNGFPAPLSVELDIQNHADEVSPGVFVPEKDVAAPVVVNDAFNVEVLSVKIDGRDVGLRPGCRTAKPAPVRLVGPGYTLDTPENPLQWFATHDPKTYFHPFYGGYMAGTINIPSFTGCRTRLGDDISALMTRSASGANNPIEAISAWPCDSPDIFKEGVYWPVAPGMNTPKKAGCEGYVDFPYPVRP